MTYAYYVVAGSGQGAHHIRRQDRRLPDLPLAGVAQRRDRQLQVLGDECAGATEQWRLCKLF